jgi:phosphopantetheinyl transferase
VEDERAALRELAHALLREELGAVGVGRLCPRCGSGDHGRPHVVVPGGAAPRVSLSYAVGLVAAAWADGPVGIDIEMDGPPVDGLDRRAWSRREALFKADAEVRTAVIEVPDGFVGTVAGTGVSSRLAGPAARAR